MSFFDDLQRLREKVPHPCILTVNSENCDYCPYHASGKNSYLIIGHNLCEDCFYGFWVGVSKNCVDCAFTEKSELMYECVDCRESYDCSFCQECTACTECWYCFDCKACQNCFGCVNLRNKQFYIFNEPYSREAYFEKVKELRKNPEEIQKKFEELKLKNPHIGMQGLHNEKVLGEYISHSKNSYYCFDVSELEDCFYIFNGYLIKDAMDCSYTGQQSELNYMCHSAVTLYNSNFCNICWFSRNLEYCEYVYNSHDCFGCVSRNHTEYEILNKKYSKDEYFKKVAEIKDQLRTEGTYGKWWWESPYSEIQPHSSYMVS